MLRAVFKEVLGREAPPDIDDTVLDTDETLSENETGDDEDEDDVNEEKSQNKNTMEENILKKMIFRHKKKSMNESTKSKKKTKKRRHVPESIANLLGEANMLYTNNEINKSIEMLKTCIKLAPTCPEPYYVLATIADEQNDKKKAMQYQLIACAVIQGDGEKWKNVGKLALALHEIAVAAYCFERVFKLDPMDIDAISAKIAAYIDLGDEKKRGESYEDLANAKPDNLAAWLKAAQSYHTAGFDEEAIVALENCIQLVFRSFKDKDSEEDVEFAYNAINMLVDLRIIRKEYQEGLDDLKQFALNLEAYNNRNNGSKEYSSDQTSKETLIDRCISELLPDLVAKYGICHLLLGPAHKSIADNLLDQVLEESPEEFGDLLLDIADAYSQIMTDDEKVLEILLSVVAVKQFDTERTWLRLAKTYENLDKYENAFFYYDKALNAQTSANSLDWTILLSALKLATRSQQYKTGVSFFVLYGKKTIEYPVRPFIRKVTAERMAETDEEDDGSDVEGEQLEADDGEYSSDAMDNIVRLCILLEWSMLEYMLGNRDLFLTVGMTVIICSLYQPQLLRQKMFRSFKEGKRLKDAQMQGFCQLQITEIFPSDDLDAPVLLSDMVSKICHEIVVMDSLSSGEYNHLILLVAAALVDQGNHVAAVELLAEVASVGKLESYISLKDLRLRALAIALEHEEHQMAYECARVNVVDDVNDVGSWNLLSYVLYNTGVFSWHQKFIAKTLLEHPENVPAMMMAGTRAAMMEMHRVAISEYTLALQKRPNDPLLVFLIAISYLNAAMQRTINDRQGCIAKAFAFFQWYRRLRVERLQSTMNGDGIPSEIGDIEAVYNTGRAYHQLGLFHLAIPMYEQVLRFYDERPNFQKEEHMLQREAAYNMSTIFVKSGAPSLAEALRKKYLTI